MASSEIGLPPPGRLLLRPKLLLKFAPSTVKFVERPSPPAKLIVPFVYGETLAISPMLRLIVGSFNMSSLDMFVVAPVLVVLNFEGLAPITVTSATSAVNSESDVLRLKVSPRKRVMSV